MRLWVCNPQGSCFQLPLSSDASVNQMGWASFPKMLSCHASVSCASEGNQRYCFGLRFEETEVTVASLMKHLCRKRFSDTDFYGKANTLGITFFQLASQDEK